MKSEGSVETPQYIVEEYNGCSVPQYTRYPLESYYILRIYFLAGLIFFNIEVSSLQYVREKRAEELNKIQNPSHEKMAKKSPETRK